MEQKVERQRELDAKVLDAFFKWRDSDFTRALDEGASPSAKSDAGAPLICLALAAGRYKIVKELIKRGADLDSGGGGREPPMIVASHALREDTALLFEVFLLLIKAGASVRARSEEGLSPLMMAARGNCAAAISALVEAGAPLEDETAAGVSALGYASAHGSLEAMMVLMEAGADLRIGSLERSSPLALASASFYNREQAVGLLMAQAQKAQLSGELSSGEAIKKRSVRI